MYSLTIDVLKILEPSPNYYLLQPINHQSLSEFDLETDMQYSLQIPWFWNKCAIFFINIFSILKFIPEKDAKAKDMFYVKGPFLPIDITFIINRIVLIQCNVPLQILLKFKIDLKIIIFPRALVMLCGTNFRSYYIQRWFSFCLNRKIDNAKWRYS